MPPACRPGAVARAALGAIVLAGCAGAVRGWRHRHEVRGSATHFARPPVVDGRRTACLLPPYAPAPDATTVGEGWALHRCARPREMRISLPGTRTLDADAWAAAITRLRARGGRMQWLSYGLCCSASHTGNCLRFDGNLCETRVEDVAREVADALAHDEATAGVAVDLRIALVGAEGPRCEANDSRCLPQPYEGTPRFDRSGARHPMFESHAAGMCSFDGECRTSGCGNHCVSWEYGGANEGSTCEGYVFNQPVFCGCVARQCAWFTQ